MGAWAKDAMGSWWNNCVLEFGAGRLNVSRKSTGLCYKHGIVFFAIRERKACMDHPVMLKITSAAFAHGGNIPQVYTCEGDDKNPPLEIGNIPEAAQTLALVMDDPDAPKKTFDHWIVWNIPPNRIIKENSQPGQAGKNSLGQNEYTGPCPPSGTHRYFFKIYALDHSLDLTPETDKKALEVAMQNHILAYGELMGKYQKSH